METSALKQQFDAIASKYDSQRQHLIPPFQDFYTCGLPLLKKVPQVHRVLDIGAGTGLFTWFLYQQFPQATYTLVDLSPEMLAMAQQRFAGLPNFSFQVMDFAVQDLPGTYDVIISALAIHHLDDDQKYQLYQKVFTALNPGGVFINADQVQGRTPRFDAFYKSSWRTTIQNSPLEKEAVQRAFERIKLDKFAPLETQLQMLETIGFQEVDCINKNLNFVVFAAIKEA